MPAFFHKHLGVNYGEAYYFDLGHKEEVSIAEQKLLYDFFGDFGVSSQKPQPDTNVFIQSVDLIMKTQGAEWRFPDDGTVESWGKPWEHLSPEEIMKIKPEDVAHHPVVDRMIALYEVVKRHHGDAADICFTKSGMMNIHTPYTAAHQLCGEEVFITMMTEPEAAQRIFTKLWDIYQAIYSRFAAVTGVKFNAISLGDCAASMLSPEVYREVVLPVNSMISRQFDTVYYHSCGSSTHLIDEFAKLPGLGHIQLGAGTDLEKVYDTMSGVHIMPLLDNVMMMQAKPDTVKNEIEKLMNTITKFNQHTILAWAFDRETPVENVRALYDTVKKEDMKK
jgi:hypothetical protein